MFESDQRVARDITPDRLLACLLAVPILLILAPLYVIVVAAQGRPFLYTSERMRTTDEGFRLFKIRTMQSSSTPREERAFGGDQKARLTRIGAILRRTRLDELPQIFNVIRGDIGFIGPRPPLRRHVRACPDLYRQVLDRSRPGITGLATVMVHAREERLLATCHSPDECERVYLSRCLPIKVRLDLIYAQRRGVGLDLLILWRTFSKLCLVSRRGHRTGSVLPVARPAMEGL